ncbi:MAG: cation transporter [Planctomycetes bacterium]|nr:cation transporter [Planctomycetota bacterium]
MVVRVDEKCKKCADHAIWICMGSNIFLCALKGVIGYFTGSLALMADSLHSGADVLDAIVAMIATRIGNKPPDEKHPYGHGKTEFMGGVFIGIVLLAGASSITINALIHLFRNVPQPPPHFIAIFAALISIAVNEMLFRRASCAAKRVNSAAIEAEAWDNRADCFSSMPVLFGVLGAQFGFTKLDPLAALLVGILVGKVGFELLSKNLHGLMDMPLHSDEIKRIKKLVVATAGVEDIVHLRTRGMGRHYMADMQILVKPRTSVKKSNVIVAELKNTLQREIKHLEDITIVCRADAEKQTL